MLFWNNKPPGEKPNRKGREPLRLGSVNKASIRRSAMERLLNMTRLTASDMNGTGPYMGTNPKLPRQTASAINRDMLPDLLISQGHATVEQIEYALKQQQETGTFFGDILEQSGILTESSLVAFLTRYCKIPYLSLIDYVIDKSVVALIPPDTCWKYHLLPLDRLGRNLTVAMVNPLNQEALTVIRNLCPHLSIKPILCSHTEFEIVAGRFFGPRQGHDELFWAQIPVPSADSADVNPMVQQRHAMAHIRGPAAKDARRAAPGPESTEQPRTAWKHLPPLDRETLLSTIFAVDKVTESAGQQAAGTNPENKTAKAGGKSGMKSEETGEAPDDTAGQFRPDDDLLYQITDAMLDSVYDTYELIARKVPFFSGLSAEDVARLYSQDTVIIYESGEKIRLESECNNIFFLILSGSVEVRSPDRPGAVLHRGDVLGETILAGAGWQLTSAVALSKTSLLAISTDMIRSNLPPNAAIQLLINVMMALSRRIKKLQEGA